MERSYFVRGRVVVVEEIDDVWAIRVDSNQDPEVFGSSAERIVTAASSDPAQQVVVGAFRDSNWRFILPDDGVRGSLSARQPIPGINDVGKVLVHQDTIVVAPFRLNVRLLPQYSPTECQRILDAKGLTVRFELRSAPNLFHVETHGEDDAILVAERLRDDADFVYAEPSFLEHIAGRYAPGDPEYPKQWQWNNTGQAIGSLSIPTPGADVKAESAWDMTLGAGVTVAVIDQGFHAAHPDLAGAISAASGYFDGNGVFHVGAAAIPPAIHGTRCAAMAGARINGAGGVGGAPQCDLLLIGTGQPVLAQAGLTKALEYVIDPINEGGNAADRADIVSVSLGPSTGKWILSHVLAEALEYASSGRGGLGTPIFWAACNRNVDTVTDEVVSDPNVIAVVKSDNKDEKTGGIVGIGAYGAAVELTAPGRDVWLPMLSAAGWQYGTEDGNSMATPCAAACGALTLSVAKSLTRDELRQILRETADKIGTVPYAGGRNDLFGYGRVNAYAAVARAQREELVKRLRKRFGCAVVAVFAAALIIYLIMMA